MKRELASEELVFENQNVWNLACLKECGWYATLQLPITIVIFVLLFLLFLLEVFLYLFTGGTVLIGLVIGTFVFVAYVKFMIMVVQPRKNYKINLESNGGKPIEATLQVYREKIVQITQNSRIEISYEAIKKWSKTPNYYLLWTKEKRLLIFAKNGFVKGTVEEFEVYVREKF